METFPTIRLELSGMKYQVVHALTKHNIEIETMVTEQVQRVIDTMDWNSEITKIATRTIEAAIAESVERHFKYGDGRKFVDSVVSDTLKFRLP